MGEERLDAGIFDTIKVEEPSAIIIDRIRSLIADGTLTPGTRLPSERELAARFGVGRGHIRKALAKLEFYGILKTRPQRGTVVAAIGVKAIEGLLANILRLEIPDIRSLLETRAILEVSCAGLAAERATAGELAELESRLRDFREVASRGVPAIEEDHLFHLALATMTKNSALASLISLITPEIIAMNKNFKEKGEERFQRTIEEHEAIARAVAARDPRAAREAMDRHMSASAQRRLPS